MLGHLGGLVQIVEQDAHVAGFMPKFVAAIAFVIVAKVVLKWPGHCDQCEVPEVGQFPWVSTVKDEADKDATDGFLLVWEVEVNVFLVVSNFAPSGLGIEFIDRQPSWRKRMVVILASKGTQDACKHEQERGQFE